MPDRQSSFDTEIEKLAYEFMINWLQYDIARHDFFERNVRTAAQKRLVEQHQAAGANAMLDLFQKLQNKYGVPGDDGQEFDFPIPKEG